MLSVLNIPFRCCHLYFQPKCAMRSHCSKEWLYGYCTVRISHTLTTAVITHLWDNYSQTLRPLRLQLISKEVGFCSILLQHCATECSLACSLSCRGALHLALPYLLHFHRPWWTEVLQVMQSQPVSLNQQVLAGEGVLTLFQC